MAEEAKELPFKERRKTNGVLLQQLERFAHLTLDALSQHIAVLNDAGIIIATNKAWRDFAGRTSLPIEDLVEGANFLDVCDRVTGEGAETAAAFAGGLRSVINHQENEFSLEYSRSFASTQQWFLIHATRFLFESSTRVVVVHENITARKQVEEGLKRDEERFRAIFETSRDGILIEDNETIFYVNHAYVSQLGYSSSQELMGRHVSEILSAEDAERMLEFGRRRLHGETRPTLYLFRGQRKDGSLVELEASVSVFTVNDKAYIMTSARPPAERALVELQMPNEKRVGGERAPIDLLSRREREILRMIAVGLCSKEIAATLCVSESTVKSHRKNIMRKIDLHDTVSLTHYAIQAGLIRVG